MRIRTNLYTLILPFFLLGLETATGQGTLSGTVVDESRGETLIGANVVIEGTSIGTATDFDGKYQFEAEAGTYTILVSYIGYDEKRVEGVEILDNEVTYLDISVSDDAVELDLEVTVKARSIDRSENAILLLQKKSDRIQDGISSQEMRKFSVSSAAGAMRKVTGATIAGGKYIYIRGLGDRYSLSQLNGLVIPSTDPYRNGAQLDLIPANLLDNIITAKTFTPDQPGTFTGGNVDIRTKSFPEQFNLTVSVSGGYNSQNNLNPNFLTHTGGSTDRWGYDDGNRARPSILDSPEAQEVFRLGTSQAVVARLNLNDRGALVANTADEIINSLNNNFAPIRQRSTIDHGFGISLGNQYNVGENKIGLILAASYKTAFSHLDGYQKANWRLEDVSRGELFNQGDFRETLSLETPTLNGMLGLAYKFDNLNSITFNALYNHNATKRSRFIFGERPDNIVNPDYLEGRELAFNEREMKNFQLGGTHVLESLNKAQVEWKASVTNSLMDEPDTRFFENQFNAVLDRHSIPASNVQRPFHFFRYLEDEQYDLKLDFTLPLGQKGVKLKTGGLLTMKERVFNESRYQIEEHSRYTESFTGDVDEYLSAGNIGIAGLNDSKEGGYLLANYVVDRSQIRNNYTGSEDVSAAYAMFTLPFSEKLRFIGGARLEKTDISVVSADTTSPVGRIDELDLLPSANLIYSLTENMNLRATYSQTLARPNMREIAPFESFDPLTKEIYLGNTDLQRTNIQNFDLRWEYFSNPGDIIAVSAYYKRFENPITLLYRRAPNPEIQFTNVANADLMGLELELRKSLAGWIPALKNLKLSTNLSIINSNSDVVDLTGLEPENRPFEGQPNFILNAALIYSSPNNGIDATLALNTIGDRLSIIGREGTPDIYDRGRSQLDFTFIKRIGDLTVKLTAQNLLNDTFRRSSEYQGQEYIYEDFTRGVTYGFGLSYTIR